MTVIHIAGTDSIASAISWCMKHVPKSDWAVKTSWPAAGFKFEFKDPESATLFSLKWAGAI